MSERTTRANGRASRTAILEAAAQVAGERGYEGASIKLISERSGLPASSIYHHFANKDELIEAVINDSFEDWVAAITSVPALGDDAPVDPEETFVAVFRHAGERLAEYPAFLRLGLLLTLEQRPDEPAARRRFAAARAETLARLRELYQGFFGGLDADSIDRLTTFTLAGSDGLMVAHDAEGRDIVEGFDTLARAVFGAARSLGWQPAPV